MGKFFAVDGPFITFLTKVGQLIILSVLWIICSLPIVTIAASTSALYYAVIKSVRREVGYPVREFIKSFKRNLGSGVIISVVIGAFYYVMYINLNYINNYEGNAHLIAYLGSWALIAISIGFNIYLFPVMSRFAVNKTKWIKMSINLCIRRLPYTAVLVVAWIALVWVTFFQISIVFLVIVPGVYCYLATYLIEPGLKLYMPVRAEGEEKEWYDE